MGGANLQIFGLFLKLKVKTNHKAFNGSDRGVSDQAAIFTCELNSTKLLNTFLPFYNLRD